MSDESKGPGNPRKPVSVQIHLDEAIAAGHYVNFVMISHQQTEFVVDLITMLPGLPRGKVVARGVLAPVNAKRMAQALAENVKKYEARFGPIEVPPGPAMEPVVH